MLRQLMRERVGPNEVLLEMVRINREQYRFIVQSSNQRVLTTRDRPSSIAEISWSQTRGALCALGVNTDVHSGEKWLKEVGLN
jgi:hypothetical protein